MIEMMLEEGDEQDAVHNATAVDAGGQAEAEQMEMDMQEVDEMPATTTAAATTTGANRFARPFHPAKWHAARQAAAIRKKKEKQQDQGQRMNGMDGDKRRVIPDLIPRFKLRGHRKHVACVKVSPDGRMLASAGGSDEAGATARAS